MLSPIIVKCDAAFIDVLLQKGLSGGDLGFGVGQSGDNW